MGVAVENRLLCLQPQCLRSARLLLEQDSLDVGQRSPGNADALPLPQIRMRQDEQARAHRLLDGVDLRVGHDLQLAPALAEDRD